MVYNFATDNNPDGASIGFSGGNSTSKLIFYGNVAGTSTPAAQPSGSAQAALTRGQASGTIATYSSTQSPAAVAQSTTAEQTLTIQSGTGGTMLLATNDILYVNKPTAQAGLGIGNLRVSSSNTLGITFDNLPAGGNITPTGAQAYSLVAIRSMNALTATLSPAAVAANSTVEQLFTVTGVFTGQLLQVSKPTAQAGLDIAGCRVAANNQVGITFLNATASPITPTASEVYTFLGLSGLDAVNNEIMYGMNVGTVGAITAGIVVSAGSSTLTGVLATDVPTGIYKPTAQAAATNVATIYDAILTADTCTLNFLGTGTGATPTASEVYGIKTYRISPVAPLKLYSQSLAPVSVAALTTAEQTFTVTGLISGSVVHVNKPSATTGLGIVGMRVSATDTLAITYSNTSGSAIVPPTETYVIGNFQVKAPGAGNVVYQTASRVFDNMSNLTVAVRTALVNLGLIAGA